MNDTYLNREEAVGRGVFEVLTDNPDDANATGVNNLAASLKKVTNSKQAHQMQNQRYDIFNPKTKVWEHRLWKPLNKPVVDRNGNLRYIIHWVQDITEIKRAEITLEEKVKARTTELEELNRELKRSNSNLEEFAHAASHDLKEPIRKIHFFTHQLKNQLTNRLDHNEIASFTRIEKASHRMSTLIDDLLIYSHVSQRPHERELVNLNKKVQNVLEDLELDIKEKDAVITIDPLPEVQGYRRQLQQLFQNLLSNSLKYSRVNVSPQIHISAETVTENGLNYNVIIVKDNGIGFEQEYAEKIFQMFMRLHGKAEYSGTGVGLSIVKKVAENHGDLFVQKVFQELARHSSCICLTDFESV